MFFDGSMRSLRAITSRSPTASSSAFAASRGLGADRDVVERGDVGAEAGRERRRDRRAPAEHVAGRLVVRARPARGVEAGRVARQRAAQVLGRVRREHADVVGPAERRVREVHDAQVGPELAQPSADERRAGSRSRARRRPSAAASAVASANASFTVAVRLPRVAEALVEARAADPVEEVVEQEPQHAVRHDVVVHRVQLGIERDAAGGRCRGRRVIPTRRPRGRRRRARPRSTSCRSRCSRARRRARWRCRPRRVRDA